MDIQEAIDFYTRQHAGYESCDCLKCQARSVALDALALMQKQEQGLVVEWIPTEWEEPNQIGTRALIYPVDDEVVLGEYLGEGRWRWFNYVIPGEDLTHWMPLPAPPQAENAIAND